MIVLSSTSDNLQIAVSATAASELQFFSSWRDRSSTTFIAGKSVSSTSGISQVSAVTGPQSLQDQRLIDYISIFNPNNSPSELSISLNSGGVNYILSRINLSAGETIYYHEGEGFSVITSVGSVKENNIYNGSLNIGTGTNAVVSAEDFSTFTGTTSRALTMNDNPQLFFPTARNKITWFKGIFPFTFNSGGGNTFTVNAESGFVSGQANVTSGSGTGPVLLMNGQFSSTLTTCLDNVGSQMGSNSIVGAFSGALSTGSVSYITNGLFISPTNSQQNNIMVRFSTGTNNTDNNLTNLITSKAGSILYFQQTN